MNPTVMMITRMSLLNSRARVTSIQRRIQFLVMSAVAPENASGAKIAATTTSILRIIIAAQMITAETMIANPTRISANGSPSPARPLRLIATARVWPNPARSLPVTVFTMPSQTWVIAASSSGIDKIATMEPT